MVESDEDPVHDGEHVMLISEWAHDTAMAMHAQLLRPPPDLTNPQACVLSNWRDMCLSYTSIHSFHSVVMVFSVLLRLRTLFSSTDMRVHVVIASALVRCSKLSAARST